ncbi:MAG: shikimate kinase [Bacteroidota bacterium]
MKKDPVWLIGFMGSGKSTHGARLARSLGYSFTDMDEYITRMAGMSIPEIFGSQGEAAFRDLERRAVEELSRQEAMVIATGGGAPCHDELISLMNASGLTVYLRLSPEALADRLKNSKTRRPLIEGKSGEELLTWIRETLGKRGPFYEEACLVVDAMDLQSSALFRKVRELLVY